MRASREWPRRDCRHFVFEEEPERALSAPREFFG